jgi:hypothetical protein
VNHIELRAAMDRMRVSASELAILAHVTPRAVNMWLAGERRVPGPLWAYFNLFFSLPSGKQLEELDRLTEARKASRAKDGRRLKREQIRL